MRLYHAACDIYYNTIQNSVVQINTAIWLIRETFEDLYISISLLTDTGTIVWSL